MAVRVALYLQDDYELGDVLDYARYSKQLGDVRLLIDTFSHARTL